MTNTKELNMWLDSKGLKRKAVAKSLGITPYALAKKISNQTEFKASEIATFSSEYGMTEDARNRIFFAAV